MLAAPFKVVLDANVLYRFTPRDTLLRAASEGFFQIYWSADAVRPLEVVDTRGDDGRPSLDVREAEIEQLYNVQDMYSRLLFIALCREQGATVYRRPRQRVVSVCVRTTVSKHNALWQPFLGLGAEVDGRLAEATQRFLAEQFEAGKR